MDHKLKVFKAVALSKSFTKAAENLFMSQPAVSRTIKTLEQEYEKAFFLRQGNSIELTDDGHIFLNYAEKLLELYAEMANELSVESGTLPSRLQLGASTTIGQYVIPKIAASLQKDHADFRFELLCGNTEKIQNLILNRQLDFGIVEGENHNTRLHYEPFVKDELVLVTNPGNHKALQDIVSPAQLQKFSFVERENGSGTRQVIENALKKSGVQPLNIRAILGSTESIKSYLRHSDHFAFLSVHSIDEELLDGQLRIIEVENLTIERRFYFVSRQGYHSRINQKLQNLFTRGYNKS